MMREKGKRIYYALVDGATEGLSDKALYDFVMRCCPKASSKKIVRAALFALTDPDVADRNVLNTIYALAIKHRMDELEKTDWDEDEDEPSFAKHALSESVTIERGQRQIVE